MAIERNEMFRVRRIPSESKYVRISCSFSLPPELILEIDEIVKEQKHFSRSDFVRMILEEYVEKNKNGS